MKLFNVCANKLSLSLSLHRHSVQSVILYGHSLNFHRNLCYAHYRIHSTHAWNAFSFFLFTFCAFFPYLLICELTTATATFQFTFAEPCWSNSSATTRGSQPLCLEKSFTYRNAIYQTEFYSSYVMRKTRCHWWQFSGWHKCVMPKSLETHMKN